jgi:hypothetical protein
MSGQPALGCLATSCSLEDIESSATIHDQNEKSITTASDYATKESVVKSNFLEHFWAKSLYFRF